jgi:quinol monooxygenase YgiN
VFLDGYIEVPPERVAAVAAALPEHIALTRAEPGCLAFEVKASPDMPGRLLVSETLVDRAAFDAHQARAQASAWAQVQVGLPRRYTITDEASALESMRRQASRRRRLGDLGRLFGAVEAHFLAELSLGLVPVIGRATLG